MTKKDMARLEGELCLSFIAGVTDDPQKHLSTMQEHAIAGIAAATNSEVPPQYQRHFQDAAAGVVVQAIAGAQAAFLPASQRPKVQ